MHIWTHPTATGPLWGSRLLSLRAQGPEQLQLRSGCLRFSFKRKSLKSLSLTSGSCLGNTAWCLSVLQAQVIVKAGWTCSCQHCEKTFRGRYCLWPLRARTLSCTVIQNGPGKDSEVRAKTYLHEDCLATCWERL